MASPPAVTGSGAGCPPLDARPAKVSLPTFISLCRDPLLSSRPACARCKSERILPPILLSCAAAGARLLAKTGAATFNSTGLFVCLSCALTLLSVAAEGGASPPLFTCPSCGDPHPAPSGLVSSSRIDALFSFRRGPLPPHGDLCLRTALTPPTPAPAAPRLRRPRGLWLSRPNRRRGLGRGLGIRIRIGIGIGAVRPAGAGAARGAAAAAPSPHAARAAKAAKKRKLKAKGAASADESEGADREAEAGPSSPKRGRGGKHKTGKEAEERAPTDGEREADSDDQAPERKNTLRLPRAPAAPPASPRRRRSRALRARSRLGGRRGASGGRGATGARIPEWDSDKLIRVLYNLATRTRAPRRKPEAPRRFKLRALWEQPVKDLYS
eukprot:tig00000540_g1941.t1